MKLPILPDSLAKQALHRGAVVVTDEPLTISTPAQPWAYALSYTLRPPAVDPDGALVKSLRFVFDLSVVQGRIGVGWTAADGASYVNERFTSRRDGRVTFSLQAGVRVGRLVFRNADTTGAPSVFIVSSARVEAHRRYRASISRLGICPGSRRRILPSRWRNVNRLRHRCGDCHQRGTSVVVAGGVSPDRWHPSTSMQGVGSATSFASMKVAGARSWQSMAERTTSQSCVVAIPRLTRAWLTRRPWILERWDHSTSSTVLDCCITSTARLLHCVSSSRCVAVC